ncbi:hypothetical protein KGA66_29530, partial [Actinocrinis puniceicyclus]
RLLIAHTLGRLTRKRSLNPKRRHRSFPRVVKRARRNSWRVKRQGLEVKDSGCLSSFWLM